MGVMPKPSALIKKNPPTAIDQCKERIRAMVDEENKLIRRINNLRDEEARILNRIKIR